MGTKGWRSHMGLGLRSSSLGTDGKHQKEVGRTRMHSATGRSDFLDSQPTSFINTILEHDGNVLMESFIQSKENYQVHFINYW